MYLGLRLHKSADHGGRAVARLLPATVAAPRFPMIVRHCFMSRRAVSANLLPCNLFTSPAACLFKSVPAAVTYYGSKSACASVRSCPVVFWFAYG